MKWETIKTTVARAVRTEVASGYFLNGDASGKVSLNYEPALTAVFDSIAEKRPFRDSLIALADRAYDIIMSYDVRCIGKLREQFPQHFPKSLLKGELIAYIEDSKDSPWVVDRA